MKKAAIYNPYLDTLGGGERYTLSFAKVLVDKDYLVDFEWRDLGILEKLESRFGISTKGMNVVSNLNRGEGYDVMFWVSDGSIPLLKARNNFLHFQFPFKEVRGNSLFNKMKFFRIRKTICNSYFTKEVIDKEYGINSSVIYPPVTVDSFKPKKKEKYILYVSRFSELTQVKGHTILIEAFTKLTKSFPDWKLIFAGGAEVGASEYLASLKELAKGLSVEFNESPSFEKLKELYANASIFWSAAGFGVNEKENPTRVEHFGISLVEAMAAGVVPIIYKAGGYKEIVEDGTNGLFWNSEEELLTKTAEIINNNGFRKEVALNAQQKSKEFSYERFAKEVSSTL